jgi:hypothetical protein
MKNERIDNIAPTYKNNYKHYIQIEKDFFSTRDVREIRNYDAINFEKHLSESVYSNPNTRKKVLDHFRRFITILPIQELRQILIHTGPEKN